MQGDENAATPNGQPTNPDGKGAAPDTGTSNSGPSPRDQPNPGLRLDDRMGRLPAERGDKGSANSGPGAQGNDNGTESENGSGPATPPGDVKPQNPAQPATPIFPANPPPPAEPGQPGNPVTPATMRLA